jgi:hypothetical protein
MKWELYLHPFVRLPEYGRLTLRGRAGKLQTLQQSKLEDVMDIWEKEGE